MNTYNIHSKYIVYMYIVCLYFIFYYFLPCSKKHNANFCLYSVEWLAYQQPKPRRYWSGEWRVARSSVANSSCRWRGSGRRRTSRLLALCGSTPWTEGDADVHCPVPAPIVFRCLIFYFLFYHDCLGTHIEIWSFSWVISARCLLKLCKKLFKWCH